MSTTCCSETLPPRKAPQPKLPSPPQRYTPRTRLSKFQTQHEPEPWIEAHRLKRRYQKAHMRCLAVDLRFADLSPKITQRGKGL
ncbi:hypothetical protein BDV98DRAFT_570180 [Pterulicium gracile]|uniref:Uncharacterized protein n=1 Tax=Pterulicium gracile TaxID=1884261 RepID=A0A5C3QE36_9AGAR|nr:hypothetical protein BDV98DRAFT_576705 [Pterula gracilis]TFK99806.1 hypothetical protein BDV98DRAFT_570180 [Pterula gracilis]